MVLLYNVVFICLLFLGWSMYWIARLPHLPFLWRWYWVWFYFTADGTPVSWLWQEIQAWVCHLPRPANCNSCCGTLQFHSYHPHHTGALWLCFYGRQWSHLWHLSQKLRHWEAHLHELEPTDWTDCVLDHSFTSIWWCPECWLDWIPGMFYMLYLSASSNLRINQSAKVWQNVI